MSHRSSNDVTRHAHIIRRFASLLITLLIGFFPLLASGQIRQDRLFIDDGSGNWTIVKTNPLTGNQTVYFPSGAHNATLIVNDLAGGQTINGGLTVNGGATFNGGLNVSGSLNITGSFSFTTPLAATSGGTGFGSYAVGDMLYASSTTALSKLTIGTANQVLGISGGIPAWVNSGNTITNNTNTPASLSVNPTNDYSISSSSAYIRLSNGTSGSLDLTGLSNTGISDGRVITLVNTSTNAIIIRNQSSNSAVGNRFDLPGGNDIILAKQGTATFIYDGTLNDWELMSTN